jgi:predicted NAD/FAD-binding protein
VDISKALEMNNSLGLSPLRSQKNKFINLHILETHERDKNDQSQTYEHPTGHRDNEILEAVWRKWAKESGFKTFEWRKY